MKIDQFLVQMEWMDNEERARKQYLDLNRAVARVAQKHMVDLISPSKKHTEEAQQHTYAHYATFGTQKELPQ